MSWILADVKNQPGQLIGAICFGRFDIFRQVKFLLERDWRVDLFSSHFSEKVTRTD